MLICEILNEATGTLKESGVTDTPRLDSEVLLSHVLGCDRLHLFINEKKSVSGDEKERFLLCIKRRLKSEPISYILGCREFMSLKFKVSEGVLIPRPDTEVLAEYAIDAAKKTQNPEILDLCTGSGALAVSIAKYASNAKVTAVDFSDICVKTAKENAELNGVEGRVTAILQDILEDFSPEDLGKCEKFDLLVSNPPYIKTDVIAGLEKDVKDYEPLSALDGGGDGLIFYRRIAKIAPLFLKNDGILAMEIGYDQAEEVLDILQKTNNFKNIDFLCDLSGIKRVIKAVFTEGV